MKEIKMYQSEDGELFKTVKECGEHELKIHAIRVIMAELLDRPTTLDFDDGKIFVQQNPDAVRRAVTRIAQLSIVDLPDDFYLNPMAHIETMLGRDICESDKFLAKAWHRFQCMDWECREWGQAYFANKSKRDKHIRDFETITPKKPSMLEEENVKKELGQLAAMARMKVDSLVDECCGTLPEMVFNEDTKLYVLKCQSCGALKAGPTKIDTILIWNKAQEK